MGYSSLMLALTNPRSVRYGICCYRKGSHWNTGAGPCSRRRLSKGCQSTTRWRGRLRQDNLLWTIPVQGRDQVWRTWSVREHRGAAFRVQGEHVTFRLGLQEAGRGQENWHRGRGLPTGRVGDY